MLKAATTKDTRRAEQYDAVVIGGGQAGLATGYFLSRRNVSFTILDENPYTGVSWRKRWDSLRLFTWPGVPVPSS